MIRLYRFLALFGLVVFQFTVLPRLAAGKFEPDILLAFTILIGLSRGKEAGCIAGFILGLLSDINLGTMLGTRALAWTQIGFSAAWIREWIVVESPLVKCLIVAGGAFLSGIFGIVFLHISDIEINLIDFMLKTLIRVGTTSISALLLIPLLNRLKWSTAAEDEA